MLPEGGGLPRPSRETEVMGDVATPSLDVRPRLSEVVASPLWVCDREARGPPCDGRLVMLVAGPLSGLEMVMPPLQAAHSLTGGPKEDAGRASP